MIKPIFIVVFLAFSSGLYADAKPKGKFLFQPLFIWGDSEASHQGTGYLLKHKNSTYGVTSIHFMDFSRGGLYHAIWCDIAEFKPVMTFTTSLGKPHVKTIANDKDIAFDFVVMPAEKVPEGYASVEIEVVEKYKAGHKIWFPNKSMVADLGYTWVGATVVKDEGHVITVKLDNAVKLQSQSGTPFICQSTGKAIGMLMGAQDGKLFLCPTRGIDKYIDNNDKVTSLMKSISNANK